ncbi:MAG: hypothetical protein JOY64_04245 [Alphaproteobacteria bacterium]|nr:hypothetical protein [Alphaproteobacteria bacterium]
MSNLLVVSPKVLACVLAIAAAPAVFAQVALSSRGAVTSSNAMEFKDPRTGEVWTPATVGNDGRPLAGPNDEAFDPQDQNAGSKRYEQTVRGTMVGKVPITAGARIPVVSIDNASLGAVTGRRWQVVLYLNNNGGDYVSPVIECRFMNGDRLIWSTRANVQLTLPGERQGLLIYGPKVEVLVDQAACQAKLR